MKVGAMVKVTLTVVNDDGEDGGTIQDTNKDTDRQHHGIAMIRRTLVTQISKAPFNDSYNCVGESTDTNTLI